LLFVVCCVLCVVCWLQLTVGGEYRIYSYVLSFYKPICKMMRFR